VGLRYVGWATLAGSLMVLASTSIPEIGSGIGQESRIFNAQKALAATVGADRLRLNEAFGKLGMRFEANRGQTDEAVDFISRGHGYAVFLTSAEAVFVLAQSAGSNPNGTSVQSSVFRMQLCGSNPDPDVIGVNELPGRTNYFVGSDPSQWRTNIPGYESVRYNRVYSGIDLVYYGQGRQLEYDFVLAPGADAKRIRLCFEGTQRIAIDEYGTLRLSAAGAEILLLKPVAYQDVRGTRQHVDAEYVLAHNREVGFRVGNYDDRLPLVIDPVVSYSTYLGGSNEDLGAAIAVDALGNVYVTGNATSSNFPSPNGGQTTNLGVRYTFVSKINPARSALLYSSFFADSSGTGIAVDASGNAYVTGNTTSSRFPTINPFQRNGGGGDAFVGKLNPVGELIYSTYLGGGGNDYAAGIAVDESGGVYVTGNTTSSDFPTANPLQRTNGGGVDVFVTKFDPSGASLAYSSYLGGSRDDGGTSIAVDTSANAYLSGTTASTDFPTANPLQGTSGGAVDAFVSKLDPTGSSLTYSTYHGGIFNDEGAGIAVDALGNSYVTGWTFSPDFPTANPFQSRQGFDSRDAFITKFDPAGSSRLYSTYLGGMLNDFAAGIAVDPSGNAYVTGSTASSDFPTVNPVQQTNNGYTFNVFVSKVNATGSVVYSTYLGGTANDQGIGIALDRSGSAYVAGATFSTDFPTVDPLPSGNGGRYDAFIAKITDSDSISNRIPFAVSNLGGASLISSGSGTWVRTGSVLIQPAPGATTPSAVAIFGLHQNNILVSETAVPASPPTRGGQIYVEIGQSLNTGIAIANPNNTPIGVNLTIADGINPARFPFLRIPANGQIARFLHEPPFNISGPFRGTLYFQSNQAMSVIALRALTNERGEFLMSSLPVVDSFKPVVNETPVIPHFADGLGWTTEILLVNPTSSPIAGDLQFLNPDGSAATVTIAGRASSTFAYSIPVTGSEKLTTEGASSAVATTGAIRIMPSVGAAPRAVVVFSYKPSGVTVSEAAVPISQGTAIRMYMESSGTRGQSGNIEGGVAVANLSSSPTNVTFELTHLDGRSATSPVSISLPGSGQTAKLLPELFPSMPSPFKGVLRITANSPGISVANLRVRYNERGDFLITTTPTSVESNPPMSTPLVIPHLTDGGGFTTQLILFSGTAGQPSLGNLSIFDRNGYALDLGLR
jgi:hypothetical protein